MTEPTDDEERPREEAQTPPTPRPARRISGAPGDLSRILPDLQRFQALQRDLFKVNLGAITKMQRMLADTPAARISKMLDAQNVISREFAKSIDFARIAKPPTRAFDAQLSGTIANTAWADSLHKSLDLSQLNHAFTQTAQLIDAARVGPQLIESINNQAKYFTSISDQLARVLPKLDIATLLEQLDRWLPLNLQDADDLDAVATVALDDGIPLAWVPRFEIVVAIVAASSTEDRFAILVDRRDDILDDCDRALSDVAGECAVEDRNAIVALRAGLHGPAQSHAANIIDSIVLAFHGKDGRNATRRHAKLDLDDLPLRVIAENLSLRPLLRALVTWWPTGETPPPEHFARHPTAHAVGQEGVFTPLNALIAVMLATSLTVQYPPPSQDDEPNDIDVADPEG